MSNTVQNTPPSLGSRFVSWTGGIVAAVLVTLAGWWLTTQPASPFVADPTVDIRILDLPRAITYPRRDLTAPLGLPTVTLDLTVLNQGSLPAEQCNIVWRDATTPDPDVVAEWRGETPAFGLAAGERKVVAFNMGAMVLTPSGPIRVRVLCRNGASGNYDSELAPE